ncbi:transcription initiation factor IIF, beta subunit-domain-containing protein [Pseudomassariella vexata]|uniref:Transcription initiation factor IIF subunit beta n=1 Tax=Pseudomassariella vexata TaxID=1141098 RepID=A0A1Y2E443_9PEZI|nr:transcription initiation factor IIF, beta subunit-domain-containing protein [Pseudomassariella vexata]ORY66289.1 transcription initiation factor IIF, beta subunit-domain-containing protein [Pseudomassariella vexata]
MASAGRVKAEPAIKPDPEDVRMGTASPVASIDDDIYEDAGDLEFYDPNIPHDPYGSVYLTHIPKYLYEQWAQLKDDDEIQIGTIRQWDETDKKGQTHTRLAMLLDAGNSTHQTVPKEYNLEVRDMNLLNTFMFTEQDLPGYKSKAQGANSNIPAHLRPKPPQRPQDNNVKTEPGRKARYQPYYRKAIPKKTALAGRFRHELNCQPVMTPETKHILAMRASDALKPKATTSILAGARVLTNGLIHAGTAAGNEKFSGFVRTADPKAKPKKANQERAARLDQAVIRDKIFAAFKKYKYWTLKAFKQNLNQPEAWLRENLDVVAVLHKSGPFANHWELRPEYGQDDSLDAQAAEAAPDQDDDDSEFDGDEEMEDVM